MTILQLRTERNRNETKLNEKGTIVNKEGERNNLAEGPDSIEQNRTI